MIGIAIADAAIKNKGDKKFTGAKISYIYNIAEPIKINLRFCLVASNQ